MIDQPSEEARVRDVIEQRRAICVFERNDYEATPQRPPAPLIFPGAFNPLHRGHALMAAHAKHAFDAPVDFELSVANVDKPPISVKEVIERLRQFPEARVWITRAATFVEKARLFPNARFVIGADTAIRLFDQKYYSEPEAVAKSINAIEKQGCRFVVFGRKIDELFVRSQDLAIPKQAIQLFDWIPEEDFRVDVSSTEIRGKRNS